MIKTKKYVLYSLITLLTFSCSNVTDELSEEVASEKTNSVIPSSDNMSYRTFNSESSSENWLSTISDNIYISDLSIPGTHESAALHEGWPNTAKCQNMTISEQLQIGVRYLDVRCRHQYNRFDIYHGFVSQRQNFSDVLTTCKNFLKEHPSEFILMSVKQEYKSRYNQRSFEDTFVEYLNNEGENMFFLENKIPKLKDVRGKIILLRRFYSSSNTSLGIHAEHGWYDNRDGVTITNQNNKIIIQDKYKFDNNDYKWNLITEHFKNITNNANNLYLNNTSGYMGLIPNITSVSNIINVRLQTYINSQNKNTKFGIVGMDFVTKELAESIYKKQKLTNN